MTFLSRFGHRRGQVEQPVHASGETLQVKCDAASFAVIEEPQQEGEEAAVPPGQVHGIEGDPADPRVQLERPTQLVE